jgi:hypothetical protein
LADSPRHSGGVVGILFRTNEKERLARKSSPENVPEAKNQKIRTKSEKRTRFASLERIRFFNVHIF